MATEIKLNKSGDSYGVCAICGQKHGIETIHMPDGTPVPSCPNTAATQTWGMKMDTHTGSVLIWIFLATCLLFGSAYFLKLSPHSWRNFFLRSAFDVAENSLTYFSASGLTVGPSRVCSRTSAINSSRSFWAKYEKDFSPNIWNRIIMVLWIGVVLLAILLVFASGWLVLLILSIWHHSRNTKKT